MSLKINLKKNVSDKSIKNYVLFTDENFMIRGLNGLFLNKFSRIINETVANIKSKEKQIIQFNFNARQKIILIKLNDKLSSLENEKNGALFYNFIKSNFIFDVTFIENNFTKNLKENENFLDEFFHGVKLKSYEFNKYKSKKIKIFSKLLYQLKTNYLILKKIKDSIL